jgi:hypothetical protein
LGSGKGLYREFRDQSSAECQNLIGKTGVFLGIRHIDARAEYSDRLAFGGNSSAMGSAIHTARHAANNDDPAGR